MATLYIAEFGAMGAPSQGGPAEVGQMPPLAEQMITIGGSSTACANAFNAATKFVRVHADAICSIAIGEPTIVAATAAKTRMAADQTEYFGVTGGHKIAAITNS